MRETISVTIPHCLGKDEALRRIKNGIGEARTTFASVLTVKEETWSGDTLTFRVNALMQETAGTIAVADNHVKLDVELPWLLAKLTALLSVEVVLEMELGRVLTMYAPAWSFPPACNAPGPARPFEKPATSCFMPV